MEWVGPYRVLGELGRGAMGVVLRAQDPHMDRQVALKLLQNPGSPASLERFRREGQLTARLSHPGIVGVHAAGEFQGRPWIAYELIEGARPLGRVFPEEAVPERLEQVLAAARALAYAHQEGVVHRDVKPENILVTPDGEVRVADFGLARAADVEGLTRTGALLGTPTHMAPEQFRGEETSPATDVYALGVVLYEALTGVLPFPATGFSQLMEKVLSTTPPRPSGASRAVEAVCLRALAKAPRDRYPDAHAFAEALAEAVAQGPGRPAGGGIRFAAAAAALLLLGGVGLAATRPAAPSVAPASPAGPSAAKPRPTPSAARLSAEEERQGQREARELLDEPDPARRLAGAEAWLARYPGHPRAAEVEAARQDARLQAPLDVQAAHAESALVAFLGDGRLLSAGGRDVRAWSPGAAGLLTAGPAWQAPEGVRALAPLETAGVVLGPQRGLAGWDPAGAPAGVAWESLPSERGACALAIRPRAAGGYVVAVGGTWQEQGWCRVLLLEADGTRRALTLRPGWPRELVLLGLALDREGRRLVLAGRTVGSTYFAKARVQAYALPEGTLIGQEHAFEVSCSHVALSADGRRLAVSLGYGRVMAGPPGGELTLLRSEAAAEAYQSSEVSVAGDPDALAFSPQGDRLYVCSRRMALEGVETDGDQVRVWDTDGWRFLATIALVFSPRSLALSPDGRQLAVGGAGGEVGLWAVR